MSQSSAEVFTAPVQPTMAQAKYIDKQKRKKVIMLVLLIAILLAVVLIFINFFRTGETPLPTVEAVDKGKIAPPAFTNVITGTDSSNNPNAKNAIKKPLGVAVHPNGNVYVTSLVGNYGKGKVEIFRPDGTFVRSFGDLGVGETLRSPTYIAINSKGEVFVSDKRLRAVYVFNEQGKYLRKFAPDGNPSYVWAPLAIAFDKSNNMYVTDIYAQHQVIVFRPDGKIKLKFGSTANAMRKGEHPGKFYYPNGIFIDQDGKIFVADSNNRRVQVFSQTGKLQYIVESGGLPRGIIVDNKDQLYVVDALGHDISVIKKTDKEGTALAVFGEQGVDFGQFLYPNSIATDSTGRRIYVTDRENNRIQVWVWPVVAATVSKQTKQLLPLFLIPLVAALLAFWWFSRRRRYFASATFLDKLLANRQLASLANVKGRVYVHEKVFDMVGTLKDGDRMLGDFIRPLHVDEPEIRQVMAMEGLNEEAAALFAAANKGLVRPRILTEDGHSHQVASKRDLESMDYSLYSEYFGN